MAEHILLIPEVRWARYVCDVDSVQESVDAYRAGEAEYIGDDDMIDVLEPTDGHCWYVNDEKYTEEPEGHTETYYMWKTWFEGDDGMRLVTPWSDPHTYEYPFDYIFDNPEDARERKEEEAPEEDWVLTKVTLQEVR